MKFMSAKDDGETSIDFKTQLRAWKSSNSINDHSRWKCNYLASENISRLPHGITSNHNDNCNYQAPIIDYPPTFRIL